MASFVELTSIEGYPILVNLDHVMRIAMTTATDPDLTSSTMLHFAGESRQLVQEPLREVIGLIKLSECRQTVPAIPITN